MVASVCVYKRNVTGYRDGLRHRAEFQACIDPRRTIQVKHNPALLELLEAGSGDFYFVIADWKQRNYVLAGIVRCGGSCEVGIDLVAVTLPEGTTAPVVSVTVPTIDAVVACAKTVLRYGYAARPPSTSSFIDWLFIDVAPGGITQLHHGTRNIDIVQCPYATPD